ncbi:MAG: ABC transporter substrate-binding protein [Frankia sp.]
MTTQFSVALVTPLTGPLAPDGLAGLRAATLWARDETLPPPWTEVTLAAFDAHPDPVAAMRSAEAIRPHAILGPCGRANALAVATATRRLIFNHGAPAARFMRPAFTNVVNIAAPGATWTREVLEAVRSADRGATKVILLANASDDTAETVAATRSAGRSRGFEVTVCGFHPGQAEVAARRLPPGDVLLVDAQTEDELAAAEVLLDRPWRAAAFSTGAQGPFAVLGDRREGLLAPRAWVPTERGEVTDGPSAAQFIAAYRQQHGSEPGPSAAAAYAAGVIIGRCVRASAGSDDTALAAAARGLDTRTLYGRFQLDTLTGIQVGHRMRVVQWQDRAPVAVWPRTADTPRIRPRAWRAAAGAR